MNDDPISFQGSLEPAIVMKLQRYMFRAGLSGLLAKLLILAVLLAAALAMGERWRIAGEFVWAAVFLLATALAVLHAWYRNRAWWRSIRTAFPAGVHGFADPQQLVVSGFTRPVAWSDVTTCLHHGPLLILFVAPGFAFPFHRSFFPSDESWGQFTRWAEHQDTKSAA